MTNESSIDQNNTDVNVNPNDRWREAMSHGLIIKKLNLILQI